MGKVYCFQCATTLTSTYRHHFVQCECPNKTFVDGGNDYCRYGGVNMERMMVLDG